MVQCPQPAAVSLTSLMHMRSRRRPREAATSTWRGGAARKLLAAALDVTLANQPHGGRLLGGVGGGGARRCQAWRGGAPCLKAAVSTAPNHCCHHSPHRCPNALSSGRSESAAVAWLTSAASAAPPTADGRFGAEVVGTGARCGAA